MLLINKLSDPGGIRRLELKPDTVRVVLRDGTERLYRAIQQERALVAEWEEYETPSVNNSKREG